MLCTYLSGEGGGGIGEPVEAVQEGTLASSLAILKNRIVRYVPAFALVKNMLVPPIPERTGVLVSFSVSFSSYVLAQDKRSKNRYTIVFARGRIVQTGQTTTLVSKNVI